MRLANKHQQQTKQQEKFEVIARTALIDEGSNDEDRGGVSSLSPETMERQKLRQLIRQASEREEKQKS